MLGILLLSIPLHSLIRFVSFSTQTLMLCSMGDDARLSVSPKERAQLDSSEQEWFPIR